MINATAQFQSATKKEDEKRVGISVANTDKIKVVSVDGKSSQFVTLGDALKEIRAYLGVAPATKQRNDDHSDKGIVEACVADQLAQIRDAIATKKQMSAAIPAGKS